MSMKKATIELKGEVLTYTTERDTFEIDAEMLTDEIRSHAMMHGLRQKISDSYAGLKTDLDITAAIRSTIETLKNGVWNAGRSTNGGIWVEAIVRATGAELEDVIAKWNEMDEDMQKELKKHPAIKAAKAEIELERAQAKAKGSKLELDDLM